MELIKTFMAVLAVALPFAICLLLAYRLSRNRPTEWKVAACVSALSIATSLVLLIGSERILFLKYGEAALQVNQKLEETKKLTEQNKRLAKLTVQAFFSQRGLLADESYDPRQTARALEDLLKE